MAERAWVAIARILTELFWGPKHRVYRGFLQLHLRSKCFVPPHKSSWKDKPLRNGVDEDLGLTLMGNNSLLVLLAQWGICVF